MNKNEAQQQINLLIAERDRLQKRYSESVQEVNELITELREYLSDDVKEGKDYRLLFLPTIGWSGRQ